VCKELRQAQSDLRDADSADIPRDFVEQLRRHFKVATPYCGTGFQVTAARGCTPPLAPSDGGLVAEATLRIGALTHDTQSRPRHAIEAVFCFPRSAILADVVGGGRRQNDHEQATECYETTPSDIHWFLRCRDAQPHGALSNESGHAPILRSRSLASARERGRGSKLIPT
jgi:hypothetical protein